MSKKLSIGALIQAKKCVSLLTIIQNELTLLEEQGYSLEYDLKNKANLFRERLDSSIKRFYGNIPEDAQLQYFQLTNRLEGALNNEMLEIYGESFGSQLPYSVTA